RGRIALVKAVAEGYLDLLSPGFVHQMSECLDCRACEAVCPSGVEYGKLLEPARTQINRVMPRGPVSRGVRGFLLHTLFGSPAMLRAVSRVLWFVQRSGLQALAKSSGLARLFGMESLLELAPRISDRFFVPRDQRWQPNGAKKATVVLHAGCIMATAFAEIDEASVRVLQRAGCEVLAPSAQGCCGAITVHAGDMDAGRTLAKRNIAAFEGSGADYYIINAAGCGSTLKEYGHLFHEEPAWHERAQAFASKVRDITEFLDEIGIDEHLGRIETTVTYQEPCHLAHAQRITQAPRNLVGKIPGVTLVEMAESSLCCGSAGIYNLTQPEMSQRLMERKAKNVAATGASCCMTANPGCQLQVQAGLRRAGSAMSVRHVIELLDESYRIADREAPSRDTPATR
ncbi:MAG: 4Fe-4S ferredoxin, partial [bacterium]|nr:4Fe-4S ferredoxin [bacterium]